MITTRIIARSVALVALCTLMAGPALAESTFIKGCFKTNDGTHYITAHRDGSISAIVDECRGYEVFEIEDVNGGELESSDPVYIKTVHGKYWTANPDGTLAAKVEHKRGWERFQIIRDTNYYMTDDNRICQSETFNLVSSHVLWVSARHEGGAEVRANGPRPRTWERLWLETEEELCEDWSERPMRLVMLQEDASRNYESESNLSNVAMMEFDLDSPFELEINEYGHFPYGTFFWNPATHTLHRVHDADKCVTIDYNDIITDDRMAMDDCDEDDPKQHWTFNIDDGTLRPMSDPGLCATISRGPKAWGESISAELAELGIDTDIDTSGGISSDRYAVTIEDCDENDEDQRHWRLRY